MEIGLYAAKTKAIIGRRKDISIVKDKRSNERTYCR